MTAKQIRFIKADKANTEQHIAEVALFDEDGTPLDPPAGGGGSAEIANGAVTTVKLADKAVTAAKIADGVIPTVPGKASTSADGLMSKEDKSKLDGVAANANNYTLPAATTGALGGVRQAAHVDGSDGTAIVSALVAAGIMAAS